MTWNIFYVYTFQGLWVGGFCFSGPTILFFQENAGSILIVIIMTTIIWGILHWIAYDMLYLSIGICFFFIYFWLGSVTFKVPWLFTPDIAHRLEMVRIMLQRLNCNVFMLSYRGYVLAVYFMSSWNWNSLCAACLTELTLMLHLSTQLWS